MKVHIFNDKSTNRPKHGVKQTVKTQGSGKIMKNEGPKHRILRGLRDKKVLSIRKIRQIRKIETC